MTTANRYPSPQFLAWARMLRLQKVLLEKIQKALADADLPPLEWYDVLLELDLSEEKRLRLFDIGERIVLSRSNLTRLCDRLEKDGLICREQCTVDRRGLYAALTAKGAALRKTMWPVYQQAVEQHFASHLSGDEATQLAEMLLRVRTGNASSSGEEAGS